VPPLSKAEPTVRPVVKLVASGSAEASAEEDSASEPEPSDESKASGISPSKAPKAMVKSPVHTAAGGRKRAATADTNGDGKVSRSEARAANMTVVPGDLNGDNKVTREEARLYEAANKERLAFTALK